jgi:hypothetical protein
VPTDPAFAATAAEVLLHLAESHGGAAVVVIVIVVCAGCWDRGSQWCALLVCGKEEEESSLRRGAKKQLRQTLQSTLKRIRDGGVEISPA